MYRTLRTTCFFPKSAGNTCPEPIPTAQPELHNEYPGKNKLKSCKATPEENPKHNGGNYITYIYIYIYNMDIYIYITVLTNLNYIYMDSIIL